MERRPRGRGRFGRVGWRVTPVTHMLAAAVRADELEKLRAACRNTSSSIRQYEISPPALVLDLSSSMTSFAASTSFCRPRAHGGSVQ